MARVVLIAWPGASGEDAALGPWAKNHTVERVVPEPSSRLRTAIEEPPALFVIDLDRRPMEGGAIGIHLRQRKATRNVPLVFAGGTPEKVSRIKTLLPDADFAAWPAVGDAMAAALGREPGPVIVPDTMAGYSGTPLPKKLGLKERGSLHLINPPPGFVKRLAPGPAGTVLRKTARPPSDVVLLFVHDLAAFEKRLGPAERALATGGRLWISWPKRTSRLASDLSEREVREGALARDLVDYKICAIDADWSALCFARRAAKARTSR